jgi:hypothetical protein
MLAFDVKDEEAEEEEEREDEMTHHRTDLHSSIAHIALLIIACFPFCLTTL